ncbi:TRAP transporter large permease subunit [Marinobacter sp.]|uniref:TRAP transporter large permease subunit n=1 Tax=Marinobacter sp. TaxID=50741 RepID=UPI0025B8603F|nr:TRAP transporter large permease subunit [Marinobacter sp.]
MSCTFRRAIERSVLECQSDHANFDEVQGKLTPGVKAYRAVELFVADLIAFGLSAQRYLLAILVMLCAITATLTRHHAPMRSMETRLDYTVSHTLQTVANAMLLGSSAIFRQSSMGSTASISAEELLLHNFWVIGFACLTLASLYRLFRAPEHLAQGGRLGQAFLAVPTAYTGASGIFVIAVGAVIYSELRAAGARRHLALAATAMSGSLGVVLRPCLLVVVIAYLNREVTTDELFGWGIWVFVLTATMFGVVAMSVNRQGAFNLAPTAEAFPASVKALWPLLPYALVMVGVVLLYRFALDVKMDEFSAPRLLPVMMLAILVYEHVSLKSRRGRATSEVQHQGLERSIRSATNDTTAEIGALLLLLGLSVSIGGVIERSHIMEAFPQAFDSAWSAMLLMVVILVILGMIMDAFGAVILVTATVATIAYASGIHPIHFWMVTLVAFELGYLSPPVALNHLLTRQVVGESEVLAAQQEGGTFYQRYERIIMPLIAMGISLLLVAFVPLLFYAT